MYFTYSDFAEDLKFQPCNLLRDMTIFQTYKNVWRQITQHSCATLENERPSLLPYMSPKHCDKLVKGECILSTTSQNLFCSGFMQWSIVMPANSFISHWQAVFKGSQSLPMARPQEIFHLVESKKAVSDGQPNDHAPCDSFKDPRNRRVPFFHSKKPHQEKIPRG